MKRSEFLRAIGLGVATAGLPVPARADWKTIDSQAAQAARKVTCQWPDHRIVIDVPEQALRHSSNVMRINCSGCWEATDYLVPPHWSQEKNGAGKSWDVTVRRKPDTIIYRDKAVPLSRDGSPAEVWAAYLNFHHRCHGWAHSLSVDIGSYSGPMNTQRVECIHCYDATSYQIPKHWNYWKLNAVWSPELQQSTGNCSYILSNQGNQ